MCATAGVITQPDAKVFHLQWRFLMNLWMKEAKSELETVLSCKKQKKNTKIFPQSKHFIYYYLWRTFYNHTSFCPNSSISNSFYFAVNKTIHSPPTYLLLSHQFTLPAFISVYFRLLALFSMVKFFTSHHLI